MRKINPGIDYYYYFFFRSRIFIILTTFQNTAQFLYGCEKRSPTLKGEHKLDRSQVVPVFKQHSMKRYG
jgi:hypothetical protein